MTGNWRDSTRRFFLDPLAGNYSGIIKAIMLTFAFVLGTITGVLGSKDKALDGGGTETPSSPVEALERYTTSDFDCRLAVSKTRGESFVGTLDDAVIYSLPETPSFDLPTGNTSSRSQLFDRSKGTEERPLYELSDYPGGWDKREIDIDGDRKDEKVLRAFLSMTRGPHLLRIVKDGYVVFEFVGQGVNARGVNGEPGFLLTFDNDWLSGDGVAVRYVVEDVGLIKPIWVQKHCGLVARTS